MTTARSRAMAGHLPPVYDTAPEALLTSLLDHFGLHLTEIDEQRLLVQRSHWLDTATERSDVARLGALLDRKLEQWEPTALFRDHLKAVARARLNGGVTGSVLSGFVGDVLAAAQRRLGMSIDAANPGGTAMVENPGRRQGLVGGPAAPLARFDLMNDGLDPAPLELNIVGWPGGRTAVPVFVLPDSSQLLGWAGAIPAGRRLLIRMHEGAEGPRVGASIDGEDVSDLLFSASDFSPSESLTSSAITTPAEPLVLPLGSSRMWYVTAGLFDRPGFDRVMFALADEDLRQGRFNEDRFASALFHQDPTVHVEFRWTSSEPAAFNLDVPAGVLAADAPLWPDRDLARERLELLLDRDVAELRAVGVRSDVRFTKLRERQPLSDRMGVGAKVEIDEHTRQTTSPGPDFGAVLDVTPLDRSRLE